ncbi:MAG: hypothetical protein M3069_23255 [Chloroflexota bacterium]|nr:hypothetical protein [Chloroflexota bacterium]
MASVENEDIQAYLGSVEAALADADAELSTDLGGNHEVTRARLWRNKVLIDWEPDSQAGGCLLRPHLLRRLVALNARLAFDAGGFSITAPGRVVAALSAEHADLVSRLGGARRVEMHATLRFEAEAYRGGQETYYLVERGQRQALLRLSADVVPRRVPEASPRTSPAPM